MLVSWLSNWLVLALLECTRVREDDALCLLNELDNLEVELSPFLAIVPSSLVRCLGVAKPSPPSGESYNSTLVHHLR